MNFEVITIGGTRVAFFRSGQHWQAIVRNADGDVLYQHMGSPSLDDVATAVVLFLGSRKIRVDLCALCRLPVSAALLDEGEVCGIQHARCPEARP